ncbi:YkgJ family cysteine cluster protein [Neobacillus pocheonensis]|uniref:YkgJ family cysteine cluster protein n=1 Tax=Neobacillus pocheonensis TaxID=363869 RepID=A0ABT0WGN1_9BACI|nr:YkgJ family cysteine cluster protein [Neobacillus pocheonensis]
MRNEPCWCGSGRKEKKCHPDVKRHSAFGNLIMLYNRVDELIKNEKGNVKCRAGCSACCYEHFYISATEFYYIMSSIIENEGESKAEEFIDRGYQLWLEFEKKYPEAAQQLYNPLASPEEAANGLASLQFIERTFESIDGTDQLRDKKPCPFLDTNNGCCSVYEYRPFICREFGVAKRVQMTLPYEVCAEMKDGLAYQEEMVDISEYTEDVINLNSILFGKKVLHQRPYPIFYFMKFLKGNMKGLQAMIKRYKELSLKELVIPS